ncbi:hypothetical protein [Antarcticirhabdus aurantiaca]|uniref:Uncharacterized protein n=1 Tax=Antarcticirhabdus aurantiaca TaxID=2606717 RepID=A0ACD4NQV0_9HYPH|nr:hypothetical protein [Antarcticirhabdus aurantiaca]WAJ29235.1 hypothetical protein OXU80_03075 [Jeongeuplla avenae]
MAAQSENGDGLRTMEAALRRFTAAGGGCGDADGGAAPAELSSAEIERRLGRRLDRAFAALGRRAEPVPSDAEARAVLYDRLARTAAAQMSEADADTFRIALALDLCALEAELETRAGRG